MATHYVDDVYSLIGVPYYDDGIAKFAAPEWMYSTEPETVIVQGYVPHNYIYEYTSRRSINGNVVPDNVTIEFVRS